MEKNYLNELKDAARDNNLNINFDRLDPDKNLFDQRVDSFDYLLLLYAVQDHFHVEVPDDAMLSGTLNTLNKILDFIKEESD